MKIYTVRDICLIRKDEQFLQRQTFWHIFFVARFDTGPLVKYPENFALKCKRSNELWLFET